MAINEVDTGSAPNDGTGDSLRTAYTKINNNFTDPANSASKLVQSSPTDSTPDRAVTTDALPNLINVKNYIVNSDMAVSQENGDGPITIPSGGTLYGRDQFSTAQSSGVTGAVTFEKGSIGNFDSYKITATSAISGITGGNEAARIAQPIESASVKVLNGETITISFKARTNWSGNLSVNLGNSDLTRSYAEIYPVVSGVNDVTVTIPAESNTFGTGGNGLGAVLWVGLNNEGSLSAASTGSWLSGDLRTSTNATQWGKTAGNFLEITEVQLVEGTVAPKYQPYTDAVYNSFRYWRKSYPDGVPPGTIVNNGQITYTASGTAAEQYTVGLPESMRSTPVITLYSPITGATSRVTREFGAADIPASPNVISEKNFSIVVSPTVSSSRYSFHYVANSRL